jgi:hypothetical protein
MPLSFLNPGLLVAGLACVALPILIHILLRRKRKPVAWGAMRFLQIAYQRQRRKTNLEQILLLASRCLLVALLALAVGKPILGALAGAGAGTPLTCYVLLDNSLPSRAQAPGQADEFEALRAKAAALLQELSPARGDRAALITLASPADGPVLPASPDTAQVARLARGVTATDARADLAGALRLVRTRIEEDRNRGEDSRVLVAFISSWREGSTDFARTLPDAFTGLPRVRVVTLAPATSPIENTAIASLEPMRTIVVRGDEGGDQPVPVGVRLSRSGPTPKATSTLTCWATNSVRAASRSDAGNLPFIPGPDAVKTTVAWNAGQTSAEVFASVPIAGALPDGQDASGRTGSVVLAASIDADAVDADNLALRLLPARSGMRVVVVGKGSGIAGMSAAVGLDTFAAADWIELALAPGVGAVRGVGATSFRQGVDVARVGVEQLLGGAGAGVPASLRDAAAIFIADPTGMDVGHWRAVRAAADAGSLIVLCPPEQPAPGWAEDMILSLELPWEMPTAARTAPGEGWPVAATPAVVSEEDDPLRLIRPELPELVKTVGVRRVLPARGRSDGAATILSLQDGTPLVQTGVIGAARNAKEQAGDASAHVVYIAAVPSLAWTDMPVKPLFVPLMQELLRQGVGRSASQRSAVAGRAVRTLPRGTSELALLAPARTPAGAWETGKLLRPTADGVVIRNASLWQARDSGDAPIGDVVFGPDTSASSVGLIDQEQLTRWLGTTGAVPEVIGEGLSPGATPEEAARVLATAAGRDEEKPPFSLPLLIAAAVVALAEAVMARVFSHAGVGRGVRALGVQGA